LLHYIRVYSANLERRKHWELLRITFSWISGMPELKTMGVPLLPFLCFTQDDTPAKIGQNIAAETVIDIISEIIWSTQVINR